MAFGFKKKDYDAKKGHLAIPEEMFQAPFADIMACMDPMYLEDAVCSEFDNIFKNRKIDDFKYLRLYPSWMSLLAKKLDDIFIYCFKKMSDFKKFIKFFPEFTYEVYEFLINEYIYGSDYDDGIEDKIDIVNDVIIPISDLERYQSYHFSSIREKDLYILDTCDSYSEMWDIIWAFETYLGIPREHYHDYLVFCFDEFVDSFDEHHYAMNSFPAIYDSDDFEVLKEFIRDAEAYWYLMDKAPKLIMENGLDLYTMLIKVIGPIKEIIDLHDFCSEFISPEFAEVLSSMM